MGDGDTTHATTREAVYSSTEVADRLNMSDDAVQRLRLRFPQVLGKSPNGSSPTFTTADVAALVAVQQLLAQGYSDDQIKNFLTPTQAQNSAENSRDQEPALTSPTEKEEAGEGNTPAAEEILKTIITNQQAILNGQSTLRDVVNVVIQDNFSLKDENRKLRDRMLEIERVMAEYQRREETRKERIEHRLRALEGTVGALQQQLAQLVQIYRNQGKKGGGWFG